MQRIWNASVIRFSQRVAPAHYTRVSDTILPVKLALIIFRKYARIILTSVCAIKNYSLALSIRNFYMAPDLSNIHFCFLIYLLVCFPRQIHIFFIYKHMKKALLFKTQQFNGLFVVSGKFCVDHNF